MAIVSIGILFCSRTIPHLQVRVLIDFESVFPCSHLQIDALFVSIAYRLSHLGISSSSRIILFSLYRFIASFIEDGSKINILVVRFFFRFQRTYTTKLDPQVMKAAKTQCFEVWVIENRKLMLVYKNLKSKI